MFKRVSWSESLVGGNLTFIWTTSYAIAAWSYYNWNF